MRIYNVVAVRWSRSTYLPYVGLC